MKEIIHLDKELLLYLNGLGSYSFDFLWISLTSSWLWIPLYLLLIFLLYRKYSLKKFLYISFFIVVGIVVSDQVANMFKYGFERLRPCHDPELVNKMRVVICGGKYGFYSAHASTTFFLATFFSILIGRDYKFVPYIFFIWAVLVSYSRIYLGVHFPGDIFVGALMGGGLGCLFFSIVKKFIKIL